jgi:hypothetical protein
MAFLSRCWRGICWREEEREGRREGGKEGGREGGKDVPAILPEVRDGVHVKLPGSLVISKGGCFVRLEIPEASREVSD